MILPLNTTTTKELKRGSTYSVSTLEICGIDNYEIDLFDFDDTFEIHMELNKLIENITIELKKEIKKNPSLELVKRSDTEECIVSFLRENLFKDDKKTSDFISSVKEKYTTVSISKKKKELTEAELCELIHRSLKVSLEDKNSEFSFVSHYFSPEKDLVIKVADKNGFESVYRVITIKTT